MSAFIWGTVCWEEWKYEHPETAISQRVILNWPKSPHHLGLRLTKRKAYFRMNLWNHSEIYWPLWHPCLGNHIDKLNTSPVRICQHEVIFFGSSLTNCGAEVNGIYLSDIFPLCFREKVKHPLPRSWTKVIIYKSRDDLFLGLFDRFVWTPRI